MDNPSAPEPTFEDDTHILVRVEMRDAIRKIAQSERPVSIEVAAMLSMELCERVLEDHPLDAAQVWIDVVGHLHVARPKRPAAIADVLKELLPALHPRARDLFRNIIHRRKPDAAEELRHDFATVLYPIDRASARRSLSRTLELALGVGTERPVTDTGQRRRVEDHGAGPDSLEFVLSGLDDSVLHKSQRSAEVDLGMLEDTDDDTQSANRLGPFDVLGEIARGGMAQVVLAKDCDEEGAICVVKRMLPWLALQESFVQMFKDEARLGLLLDHPNICSTYRYVEVDQVPCIKMEWARGLTLQEALNRAETREHAMSVPLVVELVRALASALHYAHEAEGPNGRPLRVIHRDVSPQNVVLQYDGAIKLLDFGVARSLLQSEQSQAGHVKGKFAYMSPEQSLGLPLDDRSDVFCIGICAHEALTAKPLFDRKDRLGMLRELAKGEVRDVRQHRPEVPEVVAALLRRCLAREVEARPNMVALLEELDRIEAQLPRPSLRDRAEEVQSLEPRWHAWREHLKPFSEPKPEATDFKTRRIVATSIFQAPSQDEVPSFEDPTRAGKRRRAHEDPTVDVSVSPDGAQRLQQARQRSIATVEMDGRTIPAVARARKRRTRTAWWPYVVVVLAGLAAGALVAWPRGEASDPTPERPPAWDTPPHESVQRDESIQQKYGAQQDDGAQRDEGAQQDERALQVDEQQGDDAEYGDGEQGSVPQQGDDAEHGDGEQDSLPQQGGGQQGESAQRGDAVEGTARLQVITRGGRWARVLLDGEPLPGGAPGWFTIPAGQHRVTVISRGQRTYRRIDLAPGAEGLIRAGGPAAR